MNPHKSRIEDVRRLQREWLANTSFVTALNNAFDSVGFSETYVQTVLKRPDLKNKKRKALKDGVWGMMPFDAPAMRLIDSPLIQRLRRIKQLGFTSYTYPSAEHSRFPHSIGMAHIVSRFVAAINEQSEADFKPEMQRGVGGYKNIMELRPLLTSDLVHAALLHDVGHLPFSHAAESAVEASAEKFTCGGADYGFLKDKAGLRLQKGVSLSEALSILVVLSQRFEDFYTGYVLDTPDKDAPLRIACLIGGARVLPNCGNIQSIISSSSVDADKIDYVSRDAVACGIPVGVDVSRVFLGSGLLALDKEKAQQLVYSEEDRYVFALNASGWDTFDEIIKARSTLFQRVYLHAVTRTAEALFSRALKVNADAVTTAKRGDARLQDVLSLWGLSDDAIITALTGNDLDEVRKLGGFLRDRQLPKKACAIGGNVIVLQAPLECVLPKHFGFPDQAQNAANLYNLVGNQYQKLYTRKRAEAVDTVAFEDEIAVEAEALASIIRNAAPALAPKSELENVAFISIASLDGASAEAPVFQHGELLTADSFTNVRGVTDAANHFRQIGYVMCSVEWREIVLLATRKVLYRRSISFPAIPFDFFAQGKTEAVATLQVRPLTLLGLDEVVRRVGVSHNKLTQIMGALEGAGAFNDFPVLATMTKSSDVADAAKPYTTFDGEHGWRVNQTTVAAFLDQFPPALRDDMATMLARGLFLSREEIVESLSKTIRSLEEKVKGNLLLAPLSPSSGGWALHALKHSVNRVAVKIVNSIHEALAGAGDEDAIILVDDNAASGVQGSAQLYAYAGVERNRWPLDLADETGVFEDSLSEAEIEKLKRVNLAIAVAVGHERAAQRVKTVADAVRFKGYSGLYFDREIGHALPWPADLKDYLCLVGKELVASYEFGTEYSKAGEKQAYCEEHCFGYGNFGGLTVLPTTVPASTVNALWMPGTCKGRPWIPLFLRWGAFKSLTIC